jgi:hypothetical protein
MGVAAAFAAADRSNKSLILDDEGTPFHCPARNQHPQHAYNPGKRAELGRQERGCEKPVQNRFAGEKIAAGTSLLYGRCGHTKFAATSPQGMFFVKRNRRTASRLTIREGAP